MSISARRMALRSLAVALTVATVGLVPFSARADSSGPGANPGQMYPINITNCRVIAVQLNGSLPATTKCVASWSTASTSTVQPDSLGSVRCDSTLKSPQLQLFDNIGYDTSGAWLCLFGAGSGRLSNWGFDLKMSSWRDTSVNNSPSGRIYKYLDPNPGPDAFNFAPGGSNPNVGSGWNDQARSVCITGPGSGCPGL